MRASLAVSLLAAGLLSGAAVPTAAHQVSESYVVLEVTDRTASGQCEIALKDVAFFLEPRGGATPALAAATSSRPEAIAAYVFERLHVEVDRRRLDLRLLGSTVEERRGLPYQVLAFSAPLERAPHAVAIEYRLFFEDDPTHHAILYLTAFGKAETTILDREHPARIFDGGTGIAFRALYTFVGEGVRHIWGGFDHVLFLLTLLLPSVLRRDADGLKGASDVRIAVLAVVKVVTAFTAAHSLTLSLAVLRVVTLPTAVVETAIAASVLLAAANNLRPLFGGREWAVAFAFGLLHGFGFAGALTEVGLPAGALALALLGFNLGVEIGQLAIVAVFVPLAFAARHTWAYRALVFRFGSLAIAGVATVWMIERAAGL